MEIELYRKHRPKLFKRVRGQEDAVRVLQTFLDKGTMPHALLLTGPSGVGKTTLARILQRKLDCGDGDFSEINAASFKGIDMVRDIEARMRLSPIHGKVRIWMIDEAHKLTNDAQNAFLKPLEDTPDHVYFIFTTTDPQKLLKTVLTRLTQIHLKPLPETAIEVMVKEVAELESIQLKPEIIDKITELSHGSARSALVMLHKIAGLKSTKEKLEVIEANEENKLSNDLARVLLNFGAWRDVAAILKTIQDEPETVRYVVLGYMSAVALSGGRFQKRALDVISAFEYNFYDSKKAGLIQACAKVTKL